MNPSDKVKLVEVDGYICRVGSLIDKVNHPRRYDHVANIPGEFAAAEYLMDKHWEDIDAKTRSNVEKILVASGKYQRAS